MKKAVGLLFILFFGFQVIAQTKMIAHKSHSGSSDNFTKTYHESLFDTPNSNFGGAPMPQISNCVLDSVLFINDSTTIIVTSKKDTTITDDSYWQPGRKTIINHHVFIRKREVEEIKNIIEHTFFFNNPTNTVIFIDFDTIKTNAVIPLEKEPQKIKKPQKNKKPSNDIRTDNKSFGVLPSKSNGKLPMMIGCLALFSLGFGFVLWQSEFV